MKVLNKICTLLAVTTLTACGNSYKAVTYEKAQEIANTLLENQDEIMNGSPVTTIGSFSFNAEQKQHETLNGQVIYDYSSKMNSTFNTKKVAFRAEMTIEENDNGEETNQYISQTAFMDTQKGLIMATENGETKQYYVAYTKSEIKNYATQMNISVNDVAKLMISRLAYQVILENMFQPSFLEEMVENTKDNYLSDLNNVSLNCYSKGKENLKIEVSGSFRKSPLYYDTITELTEVIEWDNALVSSMTADFNESGTYSKDEVVNASYTFTQNDKTSLKLSSTFEGISLDGFEDITNNVK